jgi:hypothetical protein
MTLEFSRQSFEQYSYIKVHENPSVATELFQTNRRRDMTKLMVAFRNSANSPKNSTNNPHNNNQVYKYPECHREHIKSITLKKYATQ